MTVVRTTQRIVIVGAGPAGIAAATTLVAAGWRPTVVDEQPSCGGQIYRAPAPGLERSYAQRYGPDAAKARRAHESFAALRGAVDHRPGTLVWGREGQMLCIARADGTLDTLAFDHVIAATGATDRHIPVPGWTLPGVYSLGGAQIALKHQLAHVGRTTVFAGNGPLLYLVAWQYLRTGGSVAAVIDTATTADKLRALPALMAKPGLAVRGVRYAAMLRARGVPVHEGASVRSIERASKQSGLSVTFSKGDAMRRVDGDAVALGYGLQPESQLAQLFDVDFVLDAGLRLWLPQVADDGTTADPLFSMAGDGCEVLGADAAALMGERAAWALAQRLGSPVPVARLAEIERRLKAERRFAKGLRRAFAWPSSAHSAVPDETIVCRCEVVTAGELRSASTQWDAIELNRLKALTRCGMGRCQGRLCGGAAAEIIAAHRQVDLATVGRLRAQPPLKPIAIRAARPPRPEDGR